MATTDAKTGFRLPWSADRNETGSPADAATKDPLTGDDKSQAPEHEMPQMIDAPPPATDQPAVDDDAALAMSSPMSAGPASDAPTAPALVRRPNKFMADLTKAMQVAAETARADTLARFAGEAKTHIENIHASTVSEATELRKTADDDVAAIREWSKAEIARIREETDERIAHRKNVLEREVETHAGEIDARVEIVQRRVTAFETQMATFFERLLAEDDPTRFASMAESLPEPPSFDTDQVWPTDAVVSDAAEAIVAEPSDGTATDAIAETTANGLAEAAPDTAWATPEGTPAEAVGPDTGDLFSIGADDPSADANADPRLQALGIDADFAAAEAEAADFTADGATMDTEIPLIADDALAARLAGLVPEVDGATTDTSTTRVVVTGLISVAAIAGFKRHLSRLSGVHTVGVSSGPDGEFVFAIAHDAGLALGDSITTLPGFAARVTSESDGELTVAARDPETEG